MEGLQDGSGVLPNPVSRRRYTRRIGFWSGLELRVGVRPLITGGRLKLGHDSRHTASYSAARLSRPRNDTTEMAIFCTGRNAQRKIDRLRGAPLCGRPTVPRHVSSRPGKADSRGGSRTCDRASNWPPSPVHGRRDRHHCQCPCTLQGVSIAGVGPHSRVSLVKSGALLGVRSRSGPQSSIHSGLASARGGLFLAECMTSPS